MDPRVDVSPAALTQEFTLEQTVQGLVKQSYEAYHQALLLHEAVTGLDKAEAAPVLTNLKDLDAKVVKLQGSQAGGPRRWRRSWRQTQTYVCIAQPRTGFACHHGR